MLRNESNQIREHTSSGTYLTVYEDDLRRRITTFPRDAQGWFYLGSHLRRQKRYDESERALRKAIEINSAPPHFIIELALLFEETGRTSEAEEALQTLGRYRQRFDIMKEVTKSKGDDNIRVAIDKPSPCIECNDYTYYGCSRSEPCAKFIVWRSSARGY